MNTSDPDSISPFPPSRADAVHVGHSDLPFFNLLEGTQLQLLRVDLDQGIWVVKVRWTPGFVVERHYHTGPVHAVTLSGRWYYTEQPHEVNTAGSYLFEPSGAVHTLKVADDIAVINKGEIVEDCVAGEIRASKHPFVQKFLNTWFGKQ